MKITCDAYGRPPPKIKWYKDDQLMRYTADGDPLTEHTMVLKFKDVKMKDQGFYKCFVWNRAGNISNTNEVQVDRNRKLFLISYLNFLPLQYQTSCSHNRT